VLHSVSGREHPEIQHLINEVVAGGRPVEQHTAPELERAVRFLT
jgi:hypothetical protein